MADNVSLERERAGAVLTLRWNRPKANAFDEPLVQALIGALEEARKDEGVRCVVLTGVGRFFSAGQDLLTAAQAERQAPVRDYIGRTANRVILLVRRMEKPVVAAVNGTAAGAGLGLALACDVRIAAASAAFVFGFTGIGLTADSGVSVLLPLTVGLGRAAEIAFSNRPVSAEQALAWGLVQRVVPDEEFVAAASGLAQMLAEGPTRAFALTKQAFNAAVLADLESSLVHEAALQEVAVATADHQEGIAAFLAKRPPAFRGT
jgi:2-(1,2-epoxy-1,2-dihydrophenyl)acetyl-CoA isomerase